MIALTHLGTSDVSETERVRAAALGDRAAFGDLYRRYAGVVHGILLARVPPDEADDLVQDVFMSAMKRLPLLRDPSAFRGWLFAIARNRAIDYYREARNRTEALTDELALKAPADTEAFMVLECVRKLPEAYRETLILRLVEGMTGPEIAERTGLTPDSVRVNLSRGMKMLRESLGRSAK